MQLRNPDPAKRGARIDPALYAVARRAALASLPASGSIALPDFRQRMAARLEKARGWDRSLSAPWYTMAIKLDLEARGEIRRLPGSPQRLARR